MGNEFLGFQFSLLSFFVTWFIFYFEDIKKQTIFNNINTQSAILGNIISGFILYRILREKPLKN